AFARAGQRYWTYERTRRADSEGERADSDDDAVGDGHNG
ncbi:MAG: hypothetical protein A07HN63_00275, partial [uncultured archaeon A07HN63]